MKFKLIIAAFVFLSIQAFSQSKNNISLVYSHLSNDVDIHGAIGDFGYDQKTGTLFGLSYTYSLTRHFALESGLLYSVNHAEMNYIIPGRGMGYNYGDIKLISVPLLAKYTFFKYVFIDGGLLVDFETNYTKNSVAPDQSGLGLSIGIGGKYNFGPVTVFVNPFVQDHSMFLQFNKSGSDFNLLDKGIGFGVGYNF